jgi:mercuric ion transport protein
MTVPSYVELIFDATCPNVDVARQQLREALARAGYPTTWVEWDRDATDAPLRVRRYASPTVLVGGRDVADACVLDGGSGCRVYAGPNGGLAGAPSAEMILAALRNA